MASHFDLILLAALAGFLIFRLFSVLGQHNNKNKTSTNKTKENIGKGLLWAIPTNQASDQKGTSNLANRLANLQHMDAQFTEQSFIKGAKVAYEVLFQAIRDADQKAIKSLCNPKVYQFFKDRIDTYLSRDWISNDELLRILSASIADIQLGSKTAKITVAFKSEQVHEMRDKQKRMVEGDPHQIEIIKEQWTFSRDIISDNPNWQLVDVS